MEFEMTKRAYQNGIFDTHAHYNDEKFDSDRDFLLSDLHENYGVGKIINCGDTLESSRFCLELARKFPFIFAAVGIHPEAVKEDKFNLSEIEKLAKNDKVAAIGEIGLDFYWDKTYKKEQTEVFADQTDIALSLSKPVIVHSREATADTLDILLSKKPSGVLHCFSGSRETAKQILNIGMYLGIGGSLTFKNSLKLREVAEYIPLDRILLETDAPYMAPEPFRGRRNNSALIYFVAEKLAEIKKVPLETVLKTTYENAERLFDVTKV